ncbi:hypothetical protein MTR67_030508 [Solanum verrucosum]|uniref:Uncharacterized protein n=1 Tax=Solanum verrucosum TaxID=315347 RepID=A0AAF0R9F7_SOLVR|nr:hypothetical protein MTR67_030508 [Solanum verrucosum]
MRMLSLLLHLHHQQQGLPVVLVGAFASGNKTFPSGDFLHYLHFKGGGMMGSFLFCNGCEKVLQRRQGMASAGLTIKELNDFLDHLASSENR